MNTVIRMYSKRRSDQLERLTGVRVVATELIKRPGENPLFIRDIVAMKNR